MMTFIWFIIVLRIVNGTYVSFISEPQNAVVGPRSNVTLVCEASSTCGTLSYSWLINDTSVTKLISKQSTVVLVELSKPVLVKCIVKCDFGSLASRKALIEIAYAHIEPTKLENIVIVDGSPTLLEPPFVRSLPQLQYKWFKKVNNELQDVSGTFLTAADGSLFIPSVKRVKKDYGIYQLYGVNPIFSPSANPTFIKEFNVSIIGPFLGRNNVCPNDTIIVLRKMQNIAVKLGSNVVVDCLAALSRCWNGATTIWMFNSQRLSSSRRLRVDSITKSFGGQYWCIASADKQIVKKSINITVVDKPQFKVMPHSKIVLQQAGDIFISSGRVDSYSFATWYFNGIEVLYGKKYTLLGDNTLKVNDGTHSDAGLYQIVYNSYGGSVSAVIQVESKTGCDSILKATSGTISLYKTNVPIKDDKFQCVWTVQTGEIQITRIIFEKFTFRTMDCANSKVEILTNADGVSMTIVKSFCALQQPGSKAFDIRGDVFVVRVKSKRSYITAGGFVLRFEKHVPDPTAATVRVSTSASLKGSDRNHVTSSIVSLPISINSASIGLPIDQESEKGGSGIIVGVLLGVLLPMIVAFLIILLLCRRRVKNNEATEMMDFQRNDRPISCNPTIDTVSVADRITSNIYAEGSCLPTATENDYTALGNNYMPLVYPQDDKKASVPNNYSYATDQCPSSSYKDNTDDIYYSVAVSPVGSYNKPSNLLSDSNASPVNKQTKNHLDTLGAPSTPQAAAYMSPMYAAVDNIDLTVDNQSTKELRNDDSSTPTNDSNGEFSEPIYNDVDEESPYQSLDQSLPRLNSDSSGCYQRLGENEPTYGVVDSPDHYAGLGNETFSDDIYHSLDLHDK